MMNQSGAEGQLNMKKLILGVLFLNLFSIGAAVACDHSWEYARDGSSCGGRAADQRAGGK